MREYNRAKHAESHKLHVNATGIPVADTNPTAWAAKYPLFSLTVTHEQPYLNNKTQLSTVDSGINKQIKWLKSFDYQNKQKYGVGVASVRVTICANSRGISGDIFAKGWVPKQHKNIDKNTVLAYSVEYDDGTSSGWLPWYKFDYAVITVKYVNDPLNDLMYFGCDTHERAWAAREQSIKSR